MSAGEWEPDGAPFRDHSREFRLLDVSIGCQLANVTDYCKLALGLSSARN